MKTQKQPIIPEDIFRLMVRQRSIPFADMVRLEKFNRGDQPQIWGWIFIPFILWSLVFPYLPSGIWQVVLLVIALIFIVCGGVIADKEIKRYFLTFRPMCHSLSRLEQVFGIDRGKNVNHIRELVEKDLILTARYVINWEKGSNNGPFRRGFAIKFDIAKEVFGETVDRGDGYKYFFDKAEYDLQQRRAL